MIAFGAIYYIMPRVTQWEWGSARLISLHFWTTGLGVGAYVTALTIGGVIQGFQLLDPDVAFLTIVEDTKPWLIVRSVSGTLMTVGHLVFAYLLAQILIQSGSRPDGPTYFHPVPEGTFDYATGDGHRTAPAAMPESRPEDAS
jgi:cytochrome c oxidase cbb3-type subunit 1